jgi:peptidoglycan/LPS O-acetylase OafA/YrhL
MRNLVVLVVESEALIRMNMLRSMSTSLRFFVWLLAAVAAAVGVGALGYFVPASGTKIYLIEVTQIVCNLLLGCLFGLIRFHTRPEIGMTVLVVILAVAMPAILLVLAIVSTLFCGIDACGH